jgi:hypothetical protein
MDATNGFEAEVLQQRWTEAFLRRKGVNRPPAILIADLPEFVDSVLSEAAQRGRALARWDGDTDAWVWMQEPEVIIINEAGLHAKLAERKRRGAPAVILYNRHSANDGLGRFVLDPELVCYYEVFSEGQRAGFAVGVSAMEGLSDADRRLRAYALFEAALSRILIVDERLDESVSDLRRTQLEATGVIIRGAHYSTRYGPADGTALFKWLAAESWDDLIIHRGVLEKIASRTQCDVADVLDTLNDTVRVVVHSGRMDVSNLPLETKFLSLSNLSAWIDGGYSKLEIVNELAALRRV